MTAEDKTESGKSLLLAGVVIGAGMGFLVDLFGVAGLALLVALAVGSAFVRPRFTLLGGVLVGVGGLWLPFTTGAVMLCAASPSSCSATNPVPFAIVALVVLITGILTLAWTRRRLARAKDNARR